MRRTGSDEALRCSFCHKSQDVVTKLISSPSDYPRSYICDECIAVCNSILEDDRAEAKGECSSITLSMQPQQQAGLRTLARMEGLSPDALIGEVVDVMLACAAVEHSPFGPASGAALVAAMQASPHREIEIEPTRNPMPARDLEF
jgi:hypothetical protein